MILDVLKDNGSVCVFDAEKDMSYDPLFASFALAAVRFVVVMVLDTDYRYGVNDHIVLLLVESHRVRPVSEQMSM